MVKRSRKNRSEDPTIQERIDRYCRDYSVRTLAEMLVEIEDAYEPYAQRAMMRAARKLRTAQKTQKNKS